MKDNLKDIIQHSLGMDLIKIVGTAEETKLVGISDDRSVVIDAKFHNPIPEFQGTFGLPTLDRLAAILNISEYNDDAVITVVTQERGGVVGPAGINFTNKSGDFNNDYRFMIEDVVNEKLKNMSFKEPHWHVDINPTVSSVQRLKFQYAANSTELTFQARTDDKGDLKFFFGDQSSHAGSFVFASNVDGVLAKAWRWPVKAVIAILDLPGEKNFKISDDGVAMITVDSGIALYKYIMPGQSK